MRSILEVYANNENMDELDCSVRVLVKVVIQKKIEKIFEHARETGEWQDSYEVDF